MQSKLVNVSPRSVLTIDLGALRQNYITLKTKVGSAQCAAVIKANGYGLGAIHVAQALRQEDCEIFFVASLEEAVTLRDAGLQETLYVFDGLTPKTGPYFRQYHLRPVLNSMAQFSEWCEENLKNTEALILAALHVDTGMNRLGVTYGEAERFAEDYNLSSASQKLPIMHVMSHLACADDSHHEMNIKQYEQFENITKLFPNTLKSLSNSAGIFLGSNFHFDLVRPGISLYGGRAQIGSRNPMQPVVKLESQILQIRECQVGETIGYGATQTFTRPTTVATIGLGYADGYFRCLSVSNQYTGGYVAIHGKRAPILGRVSMDLVGIDITDVKDGSVTVGDYVEVLGSHIGIDDVADWAGTIGYEVLTNLGGRYTRIYK